MFIIFATFFRSYWNLYATAIAICDDEIEAHTTSFLYEPLETVFYQQVGTMVSVMSPILTVLL